MKTSMTTAAIRCATTARNAGQVGKFGMGTLLRTSHLSVLHLPEFCGIPAGYPRSLRTRITAISRESEQRTSGHLSQAMQMQDTWQQDGDSRSVEVRPMNMAKPSRKNLKLKASALA